MERIIFGVLILLVLGILGCSSNNPAGKVVNDLEGNVVKIPLTEITENLNKYSYNSDGVEVKYFAVIGSDDEVRTAFDACDVCGGKKGDSQKGNTVVCNNCGTVFKIDDLGSKNKEGGCWPSYLNHEIKDGQVIIKTSDLEAGAFRFA